MSNILVDEEAESQIDQENLLENVLEKPPESEVKDSNINSDWTGRKIVAQNQKNPNDFVLWKFVSPDSLQKWTIENCQNRPVIGDILAKLREKLDAKKFDLLTKSFGCPGWHSECVAMISQILGKKRFSVENFEIENTDQNHKNYKNPENQKKIEENHAPEIDLHIGGEDHISIHHPNEIVQSEASGFQLSKLWTHVKFVLVNNSKMSKSLGNVFLVSGQQNETGFWSFENPPLHEFEPEFLDKIKQKYQSLQMNWRVEEIEKEIENLKKTREEAKTAENTNTQENEENLNNLAIETQNSPKTPQKTEISAKQIPTKPNGLLKLYQKTIPEIVANSKTYQIDYAVSRNSKKRVETLKKQGCDEIIFVEID